jgi:hypothetical protein
MSTEPQTITSPRRSRENTFLATALSLLCLHALSSPALGNPQVAVVTQLEGNAKIFTNPSKTLDVNSQAPGAQVLFEGEYFKVRTLKLGDQIERGNIVRTALGAKAKVVYPNGDQFSIGPGTAYRIHWDDKKPGEAQLSLMFGKFRGIVEKGGPRSKFQVRTRSATMGVRGTDFFVADQGSTGESEISVVRGSVEVKSSTATAATKPVEVKAGNTVEVAPPPPPKVDSKTGTKTAVVAPPPVIEVRQTTQEDLKAIQKSSEIKMKKEDIEKAKAANPELARNLETLEKKAVETTLKDIKTHDPKLYAKLQTQTITDVAQINTQVVETAVKAAPKAPPKRKPYKSELEDLEEGAYERYFKEIN